MKTVRPCHFSWRHAAVDDRASCVCIRQFRKKWWINYWNSEALSLLFQYRASWEHSKLQYHLEVGHNFSSKRNDNEEETTWSCRNFTNPGERGKSEKGRRQESNPFCSATCCQIGNERKHGKANLTQRLEIPSLQNDDLKDVKRRGLSTTFSLHPANARNNRRTWGCDHHDEWWSTFPPKRFSKHTELPILGPTNPHEVHERPLHSPKVTVWCAIGKVGVIALWGIWPIWAAKFDFRKINGGGTQSYLTKRNNAWTEDYPYWAPLRHTATVQLVGTGPSR